jgi:hypothetical protein
MKFVLCSEQTYQEMYQTESHKWIKLVDHVDLLGFKDIHVTIHDCWMYEISDDRVDFLEQQLIALADFGYISLTYLDSEGWSENYVYQREDPLAEQEDLFAKPPISMNPELKKAVPDIDGDTFLYCLYY